MTYLKTIKRLALYSAIVAAFVLVSGGFSSASAQRDPFAKPSFMKQRKEPSTSASSSSGKSTTAKVPVNYGPPMIEARIEYFKRLREQAAANGQPLPKVTSVLTLNEMAVTGIFKTPRGYAAMVEATPIKLSYTIYPGEKFFDGQLVAVEENRLVFRKVTKTGEGKFVASVENKPLKTFSQRAQIEGTAPNQPNDKPIQTAAATAPAPKDGKPASNPFLSPLDEMTQQPEQAEKPKPQKGKKPVKVAKN
ncbi:MAG: hypothetical protein KBD94_04900 [Pyrinomonadaceae bacterium]|nr:hypothetical protein [Pyrinomonadaceae bacterium]